MITLGIIMIIIGLLLPGFQILITLGGLLLIVGCILLLVRPGGRHYY